MTHDDVLDTIGYGMRVIPTNQLCEVLEGREGVQKLMISDASSLKIFGDGEQKITEPIKTGPVILFVVWD